MDIREGLKKTLIKGSLVIDGMGNPPIERGAILIEGERILRVGKEEEFKGETSIHVLDCGDQTLLPGLIDCHNHLSLDPRLENYLYRMADPIPALTLRACETMKIDLRSGVTTSRCLGDKGFLDVECKKAVAEGRIEGPRILVATRGIRAFHGHGFVGYPFSGVDQIRNVVRENLAAGADLIKIYITGTLRGPKGIPSYWQADRERGAPAGIARHMDLAAHHLAETPRDGQPQARTSVLAERRTAEPGRNDRISNGVVAPLF